MTQPLTDAINSLITYSNSVTGQSDVTLSDCVATLASGYGQGGGYTLGEVCEYGNDCAVAGDIVFDGTYIRPYLFKENMSITSFVGNNVTAVWGDTIGVGNNVYTFANCTALRYVSLPLVTDFYHSDNIFTGCTNLEEVNIDYKRVRRLATGMFNNCRNLRKTAYVFPSLVTKVYGSFLTYNPYVTAFDILITTNTANEHAIAANAFAQDTALNTIVLRNTDRITTLTNIQAFTNTPFASGKAGGTLYVPNDLISTYQSASNWSTILGYANNSIKSIESTHTDPNAPIDLTLYYADGTPIPTE